MGRISQVQGEGQMSDASRRSRPAPTSRTAFRSDLADGGMLVGHVGGDAVLLARRGERSSRSARPAPTTAGRSPKGWWSATRCAARGTTPASACAPARRCGRPAFDPDRLLAGRAARRQGASSREKATRRAGTRRRRGAAARRRSGRDRRRRRGRLRGGRDAAARRATTAASPC